MREEAKNLRYLTLVLIAGMIVKLLATELFVLLVDAESFTDITFAYLIGGSIVGGVLMLAMLAFLMHINQDLVDPWSLIDGGETNARIVLVLGFPELVPIWFFKHLILFTLKLRG